MENDNIDNGDQKSDEEKEDFIEDEKEDLSNFMKKEEIIFLDVDENTEITIEKNKSPKMVVNRESELRNNESQNNNRPLSDINLGYAVMKMKRTSDSLRLLRNLSERSDIKKMFLSKENPGDDPRLNSNSPLSGEDNLERKSYHSYHRSSLDLTDRDSDSSENNNINKSSDMQKMKKKEIPPQMKERLFSQILNRSSNLKMFLESPPLDSSDQKHFDHSVDNQPEIINISKKKKKKKDMKTEYCIALKDFDGDPKERMLRFVSGDILQIINREKDSTGYWWYAKNIHSNKKGYLPSKYVILYNKHIFEKIENNKTKIKNKTVIFFSFLFF